MKKLTKILSVLVVLTLLVSAFALFACTKKSYVQQTETEVMFTIDKDIMPDCTGKFLIDYLDALQAKGEISYVAEDGAWGKFITQINDRKADSSQGESWFIYADDEENTTPAWGEYKVGEKTYYSTNYGVTSMPIKEGVTFVFMVSKYE